MQKRKTIVVLVGIFLFVLIFVVGCGGGLAISPTGEKQNFQMTGNLTITITPPDCEVNIIGDNYQEYDIHVSDGLLKRTLPAGKYRLEFYCKQYDKITSYIEISPNNSVDFVIDFAQPQDDKIP